MRKIEVIPGQMSFVPGMGEEVYIPSTDGNLAKKVKPIAKEKPSIRVTTSKQEISFEELQTMFHEAIEIVKNMGFPLEKLNETCTINTRYSSRWGTCYHNRRTGNRIAVSPELLKADTKSIMTTLIHEVLHATEGCHNHGELWKRRANAINSKYGYNISRCASAEELGFSKEDIIAQNKYVFKCKKCGKIITKNKACGFTRHFYTYTHLSCGGNDWERIK